MPHFKIVCYLEGVRKTGKVSDVFRFRDVSRVGKRNVGRCNLLVGGSNGGQTSGSTMRISVR